MSKYHLFGEIDKTVALIGAVFALVLTLYLALIIRRPIYITVGVFLSLAFVGYLVIRKSLSSFTLSSLSSIKLSHRFRWMLNIVFFALLIFSIVCVYFSPEPYIRPLPYFVSTAFMVSVVAVEILFLTSSRLSNYLTLCEIALVGLSLEFSQILIYPGVVGIDPWMHQSFTLEILNTGHIPMGFGYSNLPLMHLMAGSTCLLTGLDYKTAVMLSISFSQVLCNMLFTYILGSFLLNKKVGLLGSLLLMTASWHVNMGFWTIPNTMGSIFVLPIIYLLIKVRRGYPFLGILLAMFVMGVSIVTHTITALFIAILLLVSWLVSQIRNPVNGKREIPIVFSIFILFAVGMLSWWTYVSGDITTLADLIKVGFSASTWVNPAPSEVVRYASSLPFSDQVFDNLGLFLYFAISLIGCLYMFSRRFGSYYTSIVAVGGVMPLSLAFFALITGRSIIEARWWYFSQMLLALPLAVSMFLLCLSLKSKLGRSLLLVCLTFSLSLFMILSPEVDMDNPVLLKNSTIRYALTGSELRAMEVAPIVWSKKIGTDTYYFKCMSSLSYSTEDISEQIYSRNYSVCQDMYVLIRREIVTHPFRFGAYTYKLQYDPENTLDDQIFSKVYDCFSVNGYVKSGNVSSLQN